MQKDLDILTNMPKPMVGDPTVHDIVLRYITDNYEKDIKILDAGAGEGAITAHLMKSGFTDITPVDITSKYWKLTDKELLICDLNDNFSQNFNVSFNLIICLEIIEHLESPFHFLRNIHKILGENGTVVISTPNVESYASRLIYLWNGRLKFFSDTEINHHHITPIFSWYARNAAIRIGFRETNVFFSKNSNNISNSFKSKVASFLFLPLRFFMKGEKRGENRIHILKKTNYIHPRSI